MATGALKTITGSLLVGGGIALVLFAIDSHGHSMHREGGRGDVASACPPAECPKCAPVAPQPAVTASALAPASAAPAASASASPSASAASSAAAPASGTSFRFVAGDIALAKGEVPRLVAQAAELRKSTGKISIEGFADGPGTDEKSVSLARRRGVLARQLLADVGLDPERLVVSTGDAGAEPDLAGQVRVRAKEAK